MGKAFDNSLSGTLELFLNINGSIARRIRQCYREHPEIPVGYPRENGFTGDADIDGLLSLFRAARTFISNASMIDGEYFPQIYRVFRFSDVGPFPRVSR